MTKRPERSFFWTLAQRAGTQNRENQLSSTFAACFTQSAWFRSVIIGQLCLACRIDKPLGVSSWLCSEQKHLPKGGRERIDLLLSPSQFVKGVPSFHIESKVESPLTEGQVEKYRKKGAEYLIALTKYPPEVSDRRLRKLGAYALRWQDLHRALLRGKPTGHIDRFIRSTFTTFLKELNMAHAENLTLEDLRRLGEHLAKLRSTKYTRFVPRQSFQVADALLDFLAEVKRQFIEAHPTMEKHTYRFGPRVSLAFDESDKFLSFDFEWALHRYGWGKHFIYCAVSLPMRQATAKLSVYWKRKSEDSSWCYESPLKGFCTRGVLSTDKCVTELTRAAKAGRFV